MLPEMPVGWHITCFFSRLLILSRQKAFRQVVDLLLLKNGKEGTANS
jgi:hypothetical protein